MYLIIFLAYRYNTIQLTDTKLMYISKHYIENTTGNINFSFGAPLDISSANEHSWGVCSNISNVTGKIYINSCTLIPSHIANKFIQYYS